MTPADIATAIRQAAPQADAPTWAGALYADMVSTGIVTAKRIAMFIGQVSVESAGFTRLSEDLDYTHAAALRAAYPSHFPVGFDPTPYIGNPEMLADYVYGGRSDLGNNQPGDGWRFRGAGLIQLTGRDWFTRFGAAVGKAAEDAADWARTPEGAARSACWFWALKGINRAADDWIIANATKAINPEMLGIHERIAACNAALAALAAGAKGLVVAAPDPDHSADALMEAEINPAPGGIPATLET